MIHIGARGFDSIGGEVVSTTSFVVKNAKYRDEVFQVIRVVEESGETNKANCFKQAIQERNSHYYEVKQNMFEAIPDMPLAYWASSRILEWFKNAEPVGSRLQPSQGLATGANGLFLRFWYEF